MRKCLTLLIMLLINAHNAYAEDKLIYSKDLEVSDGTFSVNMSCYDAATGMCELFTQARGRNFKQVTVSITVAQEASVMDEAIQAMLQVGRKPSDLKGIRLDWVMEPEIMDKLAVAGYSNKHWQQCRKTWNPPPHVVLQELLDQTRPYDAFNPLFNKYGLRVKKVYVGEKVQHAKYSSLKIPYPPGKHKDMYVLTGAGLFVALEPCKNGVCTEPVKQ